MKMNIHAGPPGNGKHIKFEDEKEEIKEEEEVVNPSSQQMQKQFE